MTKHPSLVAEFIQYDDRELFYPITLQYAVTDLVKVENDNGKLTSIVRYLKPYTFNDGKPVLLLFGLGSGVPVPSIIGSSTISQLGCIIDILNGKLIAPAI